MTEKLKPCPFCGSVDVSILMQSLISCRQCEAEGPPSDTEEEAIAAWNRREHLERRWEKQIVATEQQSLDNHDTRCTVPV